MAEILDFAAAQVGLKSEWTNVLGLGASSVLPDDDFFDLGGDLLDAVKLASSPWAASCGIAAADVLRNPAFGLLWQLAASKLSARAEESTATERSGETVSGVVSETVIHNTGSQQYLLQKHMGIERTEMIHELKTRLRKTLPAYMIPDVFIPVRKLPRNMSGKTDRKAIRNVARNLSASSMHKFMAKQGTSTRALLAKEIELGTAWAKVLGQPKEPYSPDDNFFDRGGDSVSAMRLVAHARTLGWNLTVHRIFKTPMLSDMAVDLDQHEVKTEDSSQGDPFARMKKYGDVSKMLQRAVHVCGIGTSMIEDIYPCTALQEGLIALSAKQPGSYVAKFVYELPEHIDMHKFQRSWNQVAQLTGSLRTRFVELPEAGLAQLVSSITPAWFHERDLQEYLSRPQLENASWGGESSAFAIVEDGSSRYFILTAHHAVYDGWSNQLLLAQVEKLYLGARVAPNPDFGPFIDYCQSVGQAQSAAFWLQELSGAPLCDLPANVRDDYVPREHRQLSQSLEISSDAINQKITLASKIRAAWSLLLNAYTGLDGATFAMTLSGRNAPVSSVEKMTYPTFTTVPIHIPVDDTQSINDFLATVQQRAIEMMPFEQYGMSNIRSISPELSAICNVKSLLVVNTVDQSTHAGAGLGLRDVTRQWMAGTVFHSFSLSAECSISAKVISIDLTYDPNVLDVKQVSRIGSLLRHIIRQLIGVSTSSQLKISELEIISPEDRKEISSLNANYFPQEPQLIHALVGAQTRATPHAPAICSWDGDMTYAALANASDSLANKLNSMGIGKGTLVPLVFEKSLWAVVAMLAVLKAGAAYAALDPAHPPQRLQALIQRLNASVVLTSQGSHLKSQLTSVKILAIDAAFVKGLHILERLEIDSPDPEDAALILFTSGSTGTPKGIVIDHSAFTSSIRGHKKPLRFDQSKRVFQFTAYTSDVSHAEIFTTLSLGACICIPSETQRMNALPGTIRNLQADWAYMTPSAAILFKPEDVPSLRTLVFGGETPSQQNFDRWAPKLHLINGYGPAETSIWTSCTSRVSQRSIPANIGKPVGCNAYVTRPTNTNKLVPIGGVGELIVEGPNVALGYLNDEAKTSASFLQGATWLPSSSSLPRRLYRTGDLVRQFDDGSLSFIGRCDTQVKLRGLRIELGEIEQQIRVALEQAEVAVEAVMPRDSNGIRYLAAFVAIRPDGESNTSHGSSMDFISSEDRQSFMATTESIVVKLKQTLPAFMIPTAFLPFWSLPLTAAAKTDRKALQGIASTMTIQELHQYTASSQSRTRPETHQQKQMQNLWAKTLNIGPDALGLEDSFFTRGGDSIRAMRLVGLAREEGLRLLVDEVFKYPLLSDMSQKLRLLEHQQDLSVPAFSLLDPSTNKKELLSKLSLQCDTLNTSIEDIYPCTPLQTGLVLQSERDLGTYVAQFTFKMPRHMDVDRFQKAWYQVMLDVPLLRTTFVKTGDTLLQVVLKTVPGWSYAEHLETYLSSDALRHMVSGNYYCRFGIVMESANTFFVLTAHHALFDGTSIPLMFNKLEDYYNDMTSAQSSTPFNTFIRELLAIDHEKSASYWRKYLHEPPETNFPVEKSFNYKPKSHSRIEHCFNYQPISTDGFTTATRIRTAYAILLGTYTATSDVMFAVTLSGRSMPMHGIDRIIGPTFTTVPVRVNFGLENTFTVGKLLEMVQDGSSEMIPHEQYGLNKIRQLSPGVQTACNLQSLLVVQDSRSSDGELGAKIGLENFDSKLPAVDSLYHTFAFSVECSIWHKKLELGITFDPDVLDVTQVGRFIGQFEHILQQLHNLELPVSDVETLSPADKQTISTWNATRHRATDTTLHQLISAWTIKQPNAPALSSWEGDMSYEELECKSSKLAHYLCRLGLNQGDIVPLLFEKSIWAVVTMLAVLKTGAAISAHDPSHPLQRLRTQFMKLSAKLIISSPYGAKTAQSLADIAQNLTIDSAFVEALPQAQASQLGRNISSEDTAIVLWSSGSTGTPKAIIVDHGALTSNIAGGAEVGFRQGSRMFQFTAYTSDVSMAEIFGSLGSGGCCCVPSDAERANDLTATMRRLRVDWAFFTPSVASLLDPKELPDLKTIVLGGETASAELFRTWANSLTLINAFGPAETSVWICRKAEVGVQSSGNNVGTGVSCRTWITCPSNVNKLAPVGAIGELVVEGPNVTKGYLGDPERSAAVFIQHAAWQDPDYKSRLYRTGDLVRYLSNGDIHFIGRRDTQIKMNGLKIEIGEIEHRIRTLLPSAREIAVEAVTPAGTNALNVLAAFISTGPATSNKTAVISDAESLGAFDELTQGLKSSLAKVLPTHMIPSAFIPLSTMPLNGSAKTDRVTLRKMAGELTIFELQRFASRSLVARLPQTTAELNLANVWSMTLKLDGHIVQATDNFFQSGGDSIAAMRLVGHARSFGLQLSVEQIFKCPTLADMAIAMESVECVEPSPGVEPFSLISDHAANIRLASVTCAVDEMQIEDIYPCTPLQSGMVALSLKDLGSYVARFIFKLPTSIDLKRFRASWDEVVEATPTLRTRFIDLSNELMAQVVVRGRLEWRSNVTLKDYLEEDKTTCIALGQPTTRFGLVHADNQSPESPTYFVITAHHATYDGWSMRLLLNQFEQRYEGSKPQSGPGLNRFVSLLAKEDKSRARSFWQESLDGAPQSTFPAASGYIEPSAHVQTTTVMQVSDSSLRRSDYTMATRLKAAWALLLGAYSASSDVVFAVALNGRTVALEGISDIIGPTLTTVPVRVQFDVQHQTIGEVLASIQSAATAMIPFEHFGLQNIKQISPELGIVCNLQTLMVIDAVSDEVDFRSQSGLETVTLQPENQEVFHSYPLSLECAVSDNEVNVLFTYDPNIITSQQMTRIAMLFEHVFQQFLLMGDMTALNGIELLTPQDLQQISHWNKEVYPTCESTIHGLFADRAQLQPHSPALCSWEGEITYAELDRITNTLAHLLRGSYNVKPGSLVPILTEKSMWGVVSMLSVLKAGGAPVPLDPAHPIDRLLWLVTKVEARLVLSSPSCAQLARRLGLAVCIVSRETMSVAEVPIAMLLSTSTPYDPALILFTSGTTGRPKAIIIDHAAFASSINGHATRMRYLQGSRNFQFTAYTSDVSFTEMFTSLAVGACVCIPSDEERLNDIAGAMNRMRVDWAFFTPSVVSLLDPASVPTLRTLVLGGESPTTENIEAWSEKVYLVNGFGPAECSVWCSCNPGMKRGTKGTNIGKGLGCLQWIVDPSDYTKLMPIGAIGELVVQGPNIACGYLGDQAKTEAAFVRNTPWISKNGTASRLYRTGDLVKYLPDGSIHYIGRRDTQVKLNGLRIEIGEVEEQLRKALPGITELAVEVVCSERDKSKKMLAAFLGLYSSDNKILKQDDYITWTSDAILRLRDLTSGLKAKLRTVLPSHMVPKAFIPLRRLPRTASSKTDRNMLRRITSELSQDQLNGFTADLNFRAPTSPLEVKMLSVWSKVLKLPLAAIGADDNFFERGGDSIAAMRLVSECRDVRLKLSVDQVFNSPTLSDLCQVACQLEGSVDEEELPAFGLLAADAVEPLKAAAASVCRVPVGSVEDIYPTTQLQSNLVALAEKDPKSYMASFVFNIPDTISLEQFKSAWETVYQHAVILRTRYFRDSDGELFQAIVESSITWHECSNHSDIESLAYVELGRSLSHFGLVSSHQALTEFNLTLHHSIYDQQVLLRLFEMFHHALKGEDHGKIVNFSRFIQSLPSAQDTGAKQFWSKYLETASMSTFPTTWSSIYDPYPTSALEITTRTTGSQSQRITMATRIRAAWGLLTASHADSTDAMFGVTLSGRSAPIDRIEHVLGPTITTVPVRISFDRQQSVLSFLKVVQAQAGQAVAHEQFGLRNIQQLSSEIRDACKFRSLLVVQSPGQKSEQPPVLDIETATSKTAGFMGYSMVVECTPYDREIVTNIMFDPQELTSEYVNRVAHQFSHILGQLCGEINELKVADVECTSREDFADIRLWNSKVHEPMRECVHDTITQRANGNPQEVALCYADRQYTYGEMDHLSTTIAQFLLKTGVRPREFVATCFEKSALAVVAMLGLWKAGAAYVPLGPDHPAERHRNILQQTAARFVLTSPACVLLFAQSPVCIIPLTMEFFEHHTSVNTTDLPSVSPQDPAYAIFTSGSTGNPKGVVVEHSAVVKSCLTLGHRLDLKSTSRFLQFAAYTFDASVGEMWMTMMFGACLCIPTEEERQQDLAQVMSRMRVSIAAFSPTTVALLEPNELPTLSTMLVAGEAMTQSVVDKWADKVKLVNGYGPTETCILSLTHDIEANKDTSFDTIGFGTAVNTWVVDPHNHNKIQPVGCMGELLLSGPVLARGYLNEPEKTAQSFITNVPWASQFLLSPSIRLYKTGDLVRYNDNGSLRFVGRKDTQVKVRGFRIELGEIETKAHLVMHQASTVVAEVVQAPGHAKQIALFFVAVKSDIEDKNPKPFSTNGLRAVGRQLLKTLPAYMLPSLYIPLPSIPLNSHNKADRKALRQIVERATIAELASFALLGGDTVKPKTPQQFQLRRLCAAALSREEDEVSINDTFTRMGGDSITATKLVSLARTAGLTISVKDVLDEKTLEELAVLCTPVRNPSSSVQEPFSMLKEQQVLVLQHASNVLVMPESCIKDIYPLSNSQNVYATPNGPKKALRSVQFVFELDREVPLFVVKASWNATLSTYDIMQTRVFDFNGTTLQAVLEAPSAWAKHSDLNKYLEEDKSKPICLGAALSRQAVVDDFAASKRYFVWTCSHLIYDLVTVRRMVQALNQRLLGQKAVMEPPLRYASFVNYTRNLPDPTPFWSQYFSGTRPGSICKTLDDPRPDMMIKGQVVLTKHSSIPAPIATCLQAAWALSVSRQTGSPDAIVGLSLTGRDVPLAGIETMVGPTNASIPMRVTINPATDVTQYLAHVRHRANQVTEFQHTEFKTIKLASHEARSACEAAVGVTIHASGPMEDEEHATLPKMVKYVAVRQTDAGSDALSVTLAVSTDQSRVDMYVLFDSRAVSAEDLRTILENFAGLLTEILNVGVSSTKLAELDPSRHAGSLKLDFSDIRDGIIAV